MSDVDRRQLLCGGCAALTLAACTGRNFATDDGDSGAPDTGGPGGTDPTEPNLVNPLANPDYPCNQPIVVDGEGWGSFELAKRTELQTVGGWIPATTASGFQYIVAHVEQGCYVAVERRCTHQGALIAYHPDRGQFVCPLHASVFNVDGSVAGGPAPTAIRVFFAGLDGDTVWVHVTE